jgi:pimeloyl-ACP methyl ester carboxylesterase
MSAAPPLRTCGHRTAYDFHRATNPGASSVKRVPPSYDDGPKRFEKLAWAPGIPIQYVDIGVKVRYINTGTGANLVLLHTLRTQLDVFEKIIPELASRFTVYAYDYPGHGWSDIPKAAYAPDDFYKWTAAFLEKLRDRPWGMREFALYDLDRNALTFYRDLTSAEKKRRSS